MKLNTIILPYLILLLLLIESYALKCQENTIENCIECGTGENSDKCSVCQEKYFLALDGEVCIKCDDAYYGMVGCSGTCTLIKENANVKCQENSCKEGYYELTSGYCAICSLTDGNCIECEYLKDKNEFMCKKCNDYYYPNEDGICEKCKAEKCKKCSNKDFCIECDKGYTAYPDGICYSNIENCEIGVYSTEKNSPICTKCNMDYYVDTEGLCKKCETEQFLVSCHECHEDNGKIICDKGSVNTGCTYFSKLSSCDRCSYINDELRCTECKEYSNYKYFINKNGECKMCDNDAERGYCTVCSDEPGAPCDSCYDGSALIEDKCINCEQLFDKCSKCQENQCLKCYSGYGILYEEVCTDCQTLFGDRCTNCGLNPYDGKPYCSECQYNYFLGSDGKCLHCKEDGNLTNCIQCQDFGKNRFICTRCESGYLLSNGKCVKSCGIYQVLGDDGECKSCSSEEIGLSNCELCEKSENGTIECKECWFNYNLVNGKCVNIEDEDVKICEEVENISTEETPIYSCINCPNNDYFPIIKENGVKICLKKSEHQELKACESGIVISEEEKNYACNKCMNNSEFIFDDNLNKNICKCIDEYYFDNSQQKCRKCTELNTGCLKCEVTQTSSGYNYINCDTCDINYAKDKYGICSYCNYYCTECTINEENEILCLKYKEPYFLTNTSEIKKCQDYIPNCGVCSYKEEDKTELKCDKCLDNYFINKNGDCVECYENNDINSGCLLCTDDEEKIKNIKCNKCKTNYFMTKDNICEFCLSEKNGGENCEKCDYISITNENKKIGCIKCLSPDYILLDGKCYPPIDNCTEYESYLNNLNEIKIRCKKCNDKYNLNQFYRCNKKEVKISYCLKTNEDIDNPKCLKCKSGYQLIGDKCKLIVASNDDFIEGCLKYDIEYGYTYCISCDKNYFLRMGNCIEKSNPKIFDNCEYYIFENGIFQCDLSKFYPYKWKIKAFSNCEKLINVGPENRPKYSCNKCSSYRDFFVEDENGIKTCENERIFNDRCKEGKKNTYYYNDIITCTKCEEHYILSYSKFYEKKICKDIYEEEKTSEFTIQDYESDQGQLAVNGKCNNGYFTRNGKACIKCDDITIGMEGCGGNCDFEINREYQLKCELNKCKEGYFEILPGQCEPCQNVFNGCKKCEYTENNENKIFKLEPIRKRELICIGECDNNLFKYNNQCLKCNNIFNNCKECINDNDIIKCKTPQTGYYINEKGKVIRCPYNCTECELSKEDNNFVVKCLNGSSENEEESKSCDDIPNCSRCSYNNNNEIQCSYCDFRFQAINGSCYSCKEILDDQGCSSCSLNYSDNSFYCYNCEDNYVLISNLGKCVPKNDEIKNCTKVNLISENGDNFYECRSCQYSYLSVKDLKNRTYCYYRYDMDYDLANYCRTLINLNTKLNPVFSCEKCQSDYTIIVDENQVQTCKYALYDLRFCYKGVKIKVFDEENYIYKDDYNCTECLEKYELEYDNITNKAKCKAIKCLAENCNLCEYNELYKCEECKSGYVFSKFNECILKPEITPNVHFKDIYRFALNGNNRINGEDIFGPIYTIRGLTKEDIVEMHSFIILSIFQLGSGIRNLEETKQLKTYCKYKDKITSSETTLKLVDYECIVDSESQDLSNYNLIQVNESEYSDKGNINSFGLENLVSNVQDISKGDSSYVLSELNKYIYFIIDNNLNNEFETNSTDTFNFMIKGKTDKVISENIQGELKMHESDIKANCSVDSKNKDDATLNCEINLGTIINKNSDEVLTFEEDEIISEEHNILFSGINDIKILKFKIVEESNQENPVKDNTEKQKEKEKHNNNNNNNNRNLAIGLSIGLGVPIIGIIIFLIIYFYKKKKSQNTNTNNNNIIIYNKEEPNIPSERNNIS